MDRVGIEEVSDDGLTYKVELSVSQRSLLKMEERCSIVSDMCGLGWRYNLERLPLPNSIQSQEISASLGELQKKSGIGRFQLSFVLSSDGLLRLLRARHLVIESIVCTRGDPSQNGFNFSKEIISPMISDQPVPGRIDIHVFHFNMRRDQSPEGSFLEQYDFKIAVVLGNSRMRTNNAVVERVKDTFHTGDIANIKVIAYSRRARNGKAVFPASFFASASVLRTAEFNVNVLFKEPECAIDLYQPKASEDSADIYGYASDSDLEDSFDVDSGNEDSVESDMQSSSSGPPSSFDDPSEVLQDSMDITSDSDARVAHEEGTESAQIQALQDSSGIKFLRMGRVIFLRKIAARTWLAFQNYAYFEDIKFSKLRSSYTNDEEAAARFNANGTCSPKSMYRFATMFGLTILKTMAFENIKSQLTIHNIVKETFSVFSSQYPEILEAEITVLLSHYAKETGVREGVAGVVQRLVDGETHIQPVLQRVLLHGPGVSVSRGKSENKKLKNGQVQSLAARLAAAQAAASPGAK
ncbi:hypothetical protein CYLTODRAFT_492198 [Cylindrobasidium torrendii FP15055 ss-10]|uniref:Uncharacterized protein n=1 Tax=Cylindrobasidium torrendii FP15055 ss-10 TaxID=1314674 RepID=A0A0D7B5V7_9AGAR|nr:hypothetical protein CYLTODRAFT_492198 [Cylindrobasidium torrendii FP15055 ss-10]